MADLTTTQKVADYLKKTLSSQETAVLGDAIPAVSRYIELKTGRTYTVDTENGDRYYDVPVQPAANRMFGSEYAAERITTEIVIEPADSVDGVTYVSPNGTEYVYEEGVDYVVLPRGAKTPKRSILFYHSIPGGIEVLKVSAKWGESVPADLTLAATAIVAGLLRNPFGLQRRQIEGYMEMYGKITDANPFIQEAIDANTRVL